MRGLTLSEPGRRVEGSFVIRSFDSAPRIPPFFSKIFYYLDRLLNRAKESSGNSALQVLVIIEWLTLVLPFKVNNQVSPYEDELRELYSRQVKTEIDQAIYIASRLAEGVVAKGYPSAQEIILLFTEAQSGQRGDLAFLDEEQQRQQEQQRQRQAQLNVQENQEPQLRAKFQARKVC